MRRLRTHHQRRGRPVSAAWWVGYALDDETDAMIAKKFEELERMEAKLRQRQLEGAEGPETGESSLPASLPEGYTSEGCLPEAVLEEVFRATSQLSLKMLRREGGVPNYAEVADKADGEDDEEDGGGWLQDFDDVDDLELSDGGGSITSDASGEVPPPRKRPRGVARAAAAPAAPEGEEEPEEAEAEPGRFPSAAISVGAPDRKSTPMQRVQMWLEHLKARGCPVERTPRQALRELGSAQADLLPALYTAGNIPLHLWRPRWHHLLQDPTPRVQRVAAMPSSAGGKERCVGPGDSPLQVVADQYSPLPTGSKRYRIDPATMDPAKYTPLTRATIAAGRPKGVPEPVWRKLPNVFFDFVGVLVSPPPEVDLPGFLETFPWATFVPHGFVFVWCATPSRLNLVVRAIRQAELRHCDTLLQLHPDDDGGCRSGFAAVERKTSAGHAMVHHGQLLLVTRTQRKGVPPLQLLHQRNADVVLTLGIPSLVHPTSPQVYETIETLLPFGRFCHLWAPPDVSRPRWATFTPPAPPHSG